MLDIKGRIKFYSTFRLGGESSINAMNEDILPKKLINRGHEDLMYNTNNTNNTNNSHSSNPNNIPNNIPNNYLNICVTEEDDLNQNNNKDNYDNMSYKYYVLNSLIIYRKNNIQQRIQKKVITQESFFLIQILILIR
jgi:hypothetical protein